MSHNISTIKNYKILNTSVILILNILLQMYQDVGEIVEGEMSIPSSQSKNDFGKPGFSTLDEPIRDTIVILF